MRKNALVIERQIWISQFSVPPMLDETLEFLETRIKQNAGYNYEVIVVSDGSSDKTVKVAQSYSGKYGSDKVKCLQLIKNRGKGGAVKLVSML